MTPAKKKRKAYAGVLLKPVVVPALSRTLLSPGLDEPEWRAQISRQWDERWAALFAHYGIDMARAEAFTELAAALAKDWVPGFAFAPDQTHKRRGRPRGYASLKPDAMTVFIAVETQRRRQPSLSVKRACELLATRLQTRAEVLRARYRAFLEHYRVHLMSPRAGAAWRAVMLDALLGQK